MRIIFTCEVVLFKSESLLSILFYSEGCLCLIGDYILHITFYLIKIIYGSLIDDGGAVGIFYKPQVTEKINYFVLSRSNVIQSQNWVKLVTMKRKNKIIFTCESCWVSLVITSCTSLFTLSTLSTVSAISIILSEFSFFKLLFTLVEPFWSVHSSDVARLVSSSS